LERGLLRQHAGEERPRCSLYARSHFF
jgi:hypothetical protein